LQDKLRAEGVAFDFVGELNYGAYGRDGVVDPDFDPDHRGLAGFSNRALMRGGVDPTPGGVLEALKVQQISVPALDQVLKYRPDVILLMSGANGFNAADRDEVIRAIGEHSAAHLFVATIPPQKAPRRGWEQVRNYNASLPAVVEAQRKAGKRITLVEMEAAISEDDLLPDGVHPSKAGMEKMAGVWLEAILTPSPETTAAPSPPHLAR
jgi:lysophospholipase L1-like esterase